MPRKNARAKTGNPGADRKHRKRKAKVAKPKSPLANPPNARRQSPKADRSRKPATLAPARDFDFPGDRPTDPDSLHKWLSDHLELSIPRHAIIPGHTAPFDYLVHTFFEGRGQWPSSQRGAAPPSEPETPTDCIVWANRGGGKTFLGAVATLLDLVFKDGIEIRILGGSLEQSARMHAHLRALFARDEFAALIDGRITDRRIRLLNRSTVELLAQSQASVRGTRVQKLRCDEVELFDPTVWEAAQLTTRSKHCGDLWVRGSIECLSTMHVPHGIMARLVEGCSDGALSRGSERVKSRRLFKWGLIDVLEHCGDAHECGLPRGIAFPGDAAVQTSADPAQTTPRDTLLPILEQPNPCPLLPECAGRAKDTKTRGHIAIDDALSQKSRVSEATWESEMLCLRPRRSDCVLPEFDAAVHIVRQLPWEPGEPAAWVGGMDFGFRASVVLWAGVTADGMVCIADERCSENTILDEHIRAIKSGLGRPWPALAWIGVDPAGNSRNDQTGEGSAFVLREAGLTVRARRMSVEQGLSLLRARLKPADGPPRLLIHERCRRLIESLEKYHYPADKPESLLPVKDGHDHAVDALRYLMVNLDRPYQTLRGRYPT